MFPLWTTFTQFQVSNVELCLHFKSSACIQNFHLLSDNNNAIKTLLNWASFLATSVATLSCQSQTSTQEKVPRKTHPDTSKPEQARYEHDTIPDTIRYDTSKPEGLLQQNCCKTSSFHGKIRKKNCLV